MTETNIDGALAAALAKAQGEFPSIQRDKEVTVQTKSGGSYKFKYAPLDSILNAVRKPLAANGLAITQLLDGTDLVTMLLHKDGASLSGRLPVPSVDGVQAFGSAITYLRRYSLQAILGIAAEEDDDGNTAAGNTASFGGERPQTPPGSVVAAEGGLIGVASLGKSAPVDGQLRQTPDGASVGFVIGEGNEKVQVVAYGDKAEGFAVLLATEVIGKRVQVFGPTTTQTMRVGKFDKAFLRVDLTKLKTPDAIFDFTDEPVLPEPPADVALPFEGEALPEPMGLVS